MINISEAKDKNLYSYFKRKRSVIKLDKDMKIRNNIMKDNAA